MPFAVPGPPTTYLADNKLAVRVWKPTSSLIKQICLLLPDLGWHAGYYAGLAARLNRDGALCVGYDPAGTGYSNTGQQPDEWLDDLGAVLLYAQKLVHNGRTLPLFLLAEGYRVHHVLCASAVLSLKSKYNITGVIGLSPLFLPASLWNALLACCCCCGDRSVPLPTDQTIGHIDWRQTVQWDPRVLKVPHVQYAAQRQVQRARPNTDVPLFLLAPRTASNKDAIQAVLAQHNRSKVHWTDSTGWRTLLDVRVATDRVKDAVAEWMASHQTR